MRVHHEIPSIEILPFRRSFRLSAIPAYRAPFWLPGGHLQTIYAKLAPAPRISYRRERWNTPDGDFIDLDWLAGGVGEPLVVLFHGLEGGSSGHYARSMMAAVQQQNWHGVVVHFRGCSGEANLLPRFYHSGDAAEIDWVLRRIKANQGGTEQYQAHLFVTGVSLGGNALLKWLAQEGEQAAAIVDAAVAVSAPVDLRAAGDGLARGFNRFYTRHFLRTLRRKSLLKLVSHPGLYDAGAVSRARTLREFDNLVTAPLHGYKDADDYWTRASSKPGLVDIRVPTLLVNARNDPFLPAAYLPAANEVSAYVTREFPPTGGHVGFVSGRFPGHLMWLPQRLLRFFDTQRR
ncbi:MAG: alpha/beta fold hydrolase [Burkholderiales bacterium]|nr:alpha/beta fold hydrolase [Burkholderiales bacterium]